MAQQDLKIPLMARQGIARAAFGRVAQTTRFSTLAAMQPGTLVDFDRVRRNLGCNSGVATLHVNGNPLTGEAVFFNNRGHAIFKDGSIRPLRGNDEMYFGQYVNFVPGSGQEVVLPNKSYMDHSIGELSQSGAYAVHLRGTFATIGLRSVEGGEDPHYKSLADVVKNQAVFRYYHTGIFNAVGIYAQKGSVPEDVMPPGMHLHAFSEDGTQGGHVLGFQGFRGVIDIMPVRSWRLAAQSSRGNGRLVSTRQWTLG